MTTIRELLDDFNQIPAIMKGPTMQKTASGTFTHPLLDMEGDEHTGRQSRLGMDFMAIPAEAVASLARVLYEGGKTHQDPDGSNWRKISVEGHLNHALFHINAWQRGVVGEDHLAHAMCRLVMAYTVENGG